jgi:2-polyprenyl-3-methyl-5-hydroxy-6-metoxy-1,4-benzoquinol methylase
MGLTEEEIRPRRFDDEKKAALQRDLDWLTARVSEFVSVDCPACGSAEHTPAFEKYGFRFAQCSACRTAYMNPRASQKTLAEFYGGSSLYQFWNSHIFPATRQIRKEKIFRPRVRRILDLCDSFDVRKNILIDVGAANGSFCEEAIESHSFSRVIAVEPSHALAETCRQLGIETMEVPVEQFDDLEIGADVVTSFETIEHVFSPADFIAKCRQLLAPGGILVLTCPNYEGFDIQTLGVSSDSLDAEHVNMLNPDALTVLMQRQGFDVIECSTPGELDIELVHEKVIAGEFDVSGNPFLRCLLKDRYDELRQPFQDFLIRNRLSSHMFLVARYPGKPEGVTAPGRSA